MTPNLRRTWAPREQTPHCPVMLKSGKVNAIGALVISPHCNRISLQVHLSKHHIRRQHVERFLAKLFKRITGPSVLLYDRARSHLCKEAQDSLDAYPRVQRGPFPTYAPELNPTEQVWLYLDGELSNTAPRDVGQLIRKLYRSLSKL